MDSRNRRGVRGIQTAFSVAVLSALCLPLLVWWVGPGSLSAEKPDASPWPERPRTFLAMRAWTAAVEAFVQDHIGLRDTAVRTYSSLVYFGLRASLTPTVLRGRDGWLFFNSSAEGGEPGSSTIADARGSRPLGARKVDAIADMILERSRLVSSWHGRYLFVVVPNKSSVYPEYLPAGLTPLGRGKPLEQLAARLTSAPAGPFLDLTPFLVSGKQHEEVYYHTDSHWNQLGALRGFTAIMTVLEADYPGLRVPREDDFVVRQHTADGGDLARMLDLAPFLHEPAWNVTPKVPLDLPDFQRGLKVWVYRDSFYETLPHVWQAYLPGLVVLDPRTQWSDGALRTARPDVVIQLTVERRLRFRGRRPEWRL